MRARRNGPASGARQRPSWHEKPPMSRGRLGGREWSGRAAKPSDPARNRAQVPRYESAAAPAGLSAPASGETMGARNGLAAGRGHAPVQPSRLRRGALPGVREPAAGATLPTDPAILAASALRSRLPRASAYKHVRLSAGRPNKQRHLGHGQAAVISSDLPERVEGSLPRVVRRSGPGRVAVADAQRVLPTLITYPVQPGCHGHAGCNRRSWYGPPAVGVGPRHDGGR